jgi:hypothetical protein
LGFRVDQEAARGKTKQGMKHRQVNVASPRFIVLAHHGEDKSFEGRRAFVCDLFIGDGP